MNERKKESTTSGSMHDTLKRGYLKFQHDISPRFNFQALWSWSEVHLDFEHLRYDVDDGWSEVMAHQNMKLPCLWSIVPHFMWMTIHILTLEML